MPGISDFNLNLTLKLERSDRAKRQSEALD